MNEHVVSFLFVNVNLQTGVLFFLHYNNIYHFTSHNQGVSIFDIKVLFLVVRKLLDYLRKLIHTIG